MPTDKRRINISLPDGVDTVLTKVAMRDRMPVASKALQLLEIALATEEDIAWDHIARARDKKDASFVSHHNAWV
jgi:hypothetical protein